MKLADEFNFNSIFLSNLLCILPNLLCKGMGEIMIIKNTDSIKYDISGHSFSMAPTGDIPLYVHTVIAGNDAINFFGVRCV